MKWKEQAWAIARASLLPVARTCTNKCEVLKLSGWYDWPEIVRLVRLAADLYTTGKVSRDDPLDLRTYSSHNSDSLGTEVSGLYVGHVVHVFDQNAVL
jgi:hypothetical protein